MEACLARPRPRRSSVKIGVQAGASTRSWMRRSTRKRALLKREMRPTFVHFEGLVTYYDPSNRNREYGEAKAFAHIQWLIERAQNNPESASALYYYDDEKDEDMYRLTNLTESDLYKESFKMSSTASALEKLSGKGAGRGAGNAKGVGRGQSLGGATALGGDVTLPPGDLSLPKPLWRQLSKT